MQPPIALEPFTFPRQVTSAQDVDALLLALAITERSAEQKDADLRRRIVRMRTDRRVL